MTRCPCPPGKAASPSIDQPEPRLAVEKRVYFKSWWLPWVLLAPQVAVIAVFFFWPAGQALVQSLQQQDAFGTSVEWVGLENFVRLWNDTSYLE